jgi:Lar family restriction alleviation protein
MKNQPENLNETEIPALHTIIRPCPFCGGDAELILRGNTFTKKRNAEIRCGNCNVEMVVGAIRNSLDWCAKTVIAKWNKRVGEHCI